LAKGPANLTATPANLAANPGQSGRLLRSSYLDLVTKIKTTKTCDIIADEVEEEMKEEDFKKYQERLRQLRATNEGWEDKGDHWEKYDPETRTILRKRKPVHDPQRWNGSRESH